MEQLEWIPIQQNLITQMAKVAVPRRSLNRPDLFRGALEFETGHRIEFQRVSAADARSVNFGTVPMEVRQLFNATGAEEVLVANNSNGGRIYLKYRRAGRCFYLELVQST